MPRSPFDPSFDQLPDIIPIFPLTGVLLLPGARLPLNIFEPRYLAMVSDALGKDRLIGLVQPQEGQGDQGEPPVYRTGSVGRIIAFSENDDGRYQIALNGLARFDIVGELPLLRGYRRVKVDWSPYRSDLDSGIEADGASNAQTKLRGTGRSRFLTVLKPYVAHLNIQVNWDQVTQMPDDFLVNMTAMVCPFAPNEKQALLQAPDLTLRAEMLISLIEMALLPMAGTDRPQARH